MTATVNWAALIHRMDVAKDLRGVLSDREVALATGISPSTMTRLRQGKAMSADGLASLVVWLYPSAYPEWIIAAGDPQ